MINIIVAFNFKNVIGKDNQLIWRQSSDLKRFKLLTTNKCVVMGRKTYDSIGKPLPNRKNIILSRNTIKIEGCQVINSIDDILNIKEDIFIIGGGEIYQKFLPYADKIYITKVHNDIDGDTYFPEINMNDWNIESSEYYKKDEKNEYDYSFINLKKNRIRI